MVEAGVQAGMPPRGRALGTRSPGLQVSQLRQDHVLLQTATTINFTTGPFGRLLCAGVDYQIEHHLFPGLGHRHYRRMAPRVAEFCREQGYPYRVMSWRTAVWKSLRAMATPRPVVRDLGDLRDPKRDDAA